MLITNMLPLLSRYSLGLDLVAGPNGMVTMIVIPRKAEGAKHNPDVSELRPISVTATAEELDAVLAEGEGGVLGQLVASRKALADQLAEQRSAAEDAKTKASAKAKPAAPKASAKPPEPAAPASARPAAPAGEPVKLF